MPKTIRAAGTVIITGATSGIGRSFAHAYARRGYSLFLTGRRSELLDHVAEEIRSRFEAAVRYRIVELGDRRQLRELAEELAHLEDPAGLINNAGFGRNVPFLDDDIDAQVGMVTVHVEATMRLTHAVAPRLIERGAGDIINVSSLASLFPLPRGAIYASTKAWVERFTESLAVELGPRGIRCQALLPGFTRTDFHRDPLYEGLDRRSRGLIRWMEPAEVVAASLEALERRGKTVCVPGVANRIILRIARIVPRRILRGAVRHKRFP